MIRYRSFTLLIFTLLCMPCFAQHETDSVFTVDSIIIKGNRKTKTNIISRELTFSKGDTIQNWQYQKEQSRRQLINLFLFNEIHIDRRGGIITVAITERWYIWPYPEIGYADRNFSQWLLTHDAKRLIYGINLEWYNIRGRNETMQLDLIMGYTRMVNFGYKVPYFNKRQTWGAQVFATYSSNKEVWYKTDSNRVQFFRDKDRNLISRKGLELSVTHRKKIFSYHQFYTGYMEIHVADTVSSPEVNANYLLHNDTRQRELYLGYNYTYDRRDFKGYPLNGHLVKAGIEGSQFLSSRGGVQTITLRASASKYFRISGPFFGSVNATARYYSLDTPPYNKVRALGYNKDYIRGYELKVIDGNHFALGKAELKCRFLNKKYRFLKQLRNYEMVPVSLFLTGYFDMGYVYQEGNPAANHNDLPNSWQYGSGTGLNIVLFYDYCFRAEYSFDKYLNNRMYFSFVASM